jgi:hypothetical protein
VLLHHCQSPVLRKLQKVALKKAAMAELVLPHVFADLAAHDADTTLMIAISEQVRVSEPPTQTSKTVLERGFLKPVP